WSEVRICAPCSRGRNAQRPGERRRRRIDNRAREEKRRPGLTAKVSRQRQHVKDGEAATNGHLPIAARIPSKTEPRFEITSGGVRVERGNAVATRLSEDDVRRGRRRRTAVGYRVRDVAEAGELAVPLRQLRGHFIPQPQLQGEVVTDVPVVLDV